MPEKITNHTSNLITTVHGVLLNIRGLGVLIIGDSGIGKSDFALELISKGSKLISDDVVEIRCTALNKLVGASPKATKHLMEIRGLGIINIKDLYGPDSVMEEIEIDMVVGLSNWDSDTEYDRLGIDEQSYKIAGVDLPYNLIPVRPERNIALIIEVAVLNRVLKLSDGEAKNRIWHQLNNIRAAAGIK